MSRCSHVVLVQPGATELCSQMRVVGGLDVSLSPRGIEQVAATGTFLHELVTKDLAVGAIYSSDSGPAFESAQILASQLGLPIVATPLLANQSLGLWEGLQKSEIERKYGRRFCSKSTFLDVESPPEGESGDDVRQRVATILKKATRRYLGLVIVADDPLIRYVREFLSPAETMILEAPEKGFSSSQTAPELQKSPSALGESGHELATVKVAEVDHCHCELLTICNTIPAPRIASRWSIFSGWMGQGTGANSNSVTAVAESQTI